MIIRNGEVFQEDGSFKVQDLYVENHKIVAGEEEVTDKTVTVHLDMIFLTQTRKALRLF